MKDLTVGKEHKVIISFTLPILIGNVFQQLYNVVDSVVVGRALGTQSLAAVGFCFQINLFLFALTVGTTLGVGIVISQSYGAGDFDRIRTAVQTGFAFTFIASIVVSALGYAFCESILRLFRVPEDALPYAFEYLRIIFLGVVPSFLYNAATTALRGVGDSKSPVCFLVAATVVNLILDLVFILYFGWGVAGAAIATVISQVFSFVGCYVYLLFKYPEFNAGINNWKISTPMLKECLEIGIPAAMQQMFRSIGLMAMQVLVNGFGSTCMAAYAVASRIDAFAEMPVLNMGQAFSNFTAQNLGAKKESRVLNGYKASMLMGSAISIAIGAIIIAFPDLFTQMFTDDPEILEISRTYLRIVASFYIFYAGVQITNGALLGYGKTFVPMIATIIALLMIEVPVAYILSSGPLGYVGIWLATPTGWICGLTIRVAYFYRKVKPYQRNLQL